MSVLKLKKDDGTWEEINTIQGPAGPQGPQGETGPAGPQGPQGEVPNLATVATSGSYNDLIDKPDISGGASTATEVSFDDTTAQIGKTNVQEAIEYLADESVDSTSVQQQIDTNLFDIYGNSEYKNPQGNYYFFNPEEIYKITPNDGLDISSPLYMWKAAGLEPWNALNRVIIVKWERDSQFFDVDTAESRPRGCTLLKNHYYLLDLHKMPKGSIYDLQYWGERNDYQDNRNLTAKDTTNATFLPRIIYSRLTGMNQDLGYCYIYDITPYFQIAQHEQEIATLKAQVATLLNNNPTTVA